MSRPNARVWVTGSGAVSCVGTGVDALWNASDQGRTGIGSDGLGYAREASAGRSAPVDLAVRSMDEAVQQAGWASEARGALGPDDGLILATTVGRIPTWDQQLIDCLAGRRPLKEFSLVSEHQPLGSLLTAVSGALAFTGSHSLLVASACSAATQAIGLGALWVRTGRVRRCLVGGVEVLSPLTVEGFRSLQLLSPGPARPFDLNRNGINLSEGAAFLCLEREPSGARWAEIAGFGCATDAHHMTAPHPEGHGSLVAMTKALENAGLTASAVSWVHAHGTGSRANDRAESFALASLFADRTPAPVSSTKGVHGHALGASGALEAVLCVEAIRRGRLLGTTGLSQADPALPIAPLRESRAGEVNHILKNTLGFGGNNAALVFSRPGVA